MKKIAFIVCVVGVIFSNLYSGRLKVAKLKGYHYNDLLKGQIEVEITLTYEQLSNGVDGIILTIEDIFFPVSIFMDDVARHNLIALIDKYREWNIKASKKNVKLEKEIGIVYATCAFEYGGDLHFAEESTITAVFLSQTTKKHQFVLVFPKLNSSTNKFISVKPEEVYFWFKDIMVLRNAITDEAIQKYRKKYEKQKKIEEEFK